MSTFPNRQAMRQYYHTLYWTRGLSYTQIAAKTGQSPTKVCDLFRRLQIPRRARGGANNPQGRTDQRFRWRGQVTTVSALAKAHGHYPSTVYKRLRRGFPLPLALRHYAGRLEGIGEEGV